MFSAKKSVFILECFIALKRTTNYYNSDIIIIIRPKNNNNNCNVITTGVKIMMNDIFYYLGITVY